MKPRDKSRQRTGTPTGAEDRVSGAVLGFLGAVAISLFLMITGRFYQIQVVHHSFLDSMGRSERKMTRGEVFDRDLRPLAVNNRVWDLYLQLPENVREAMELVDKVASIYPAERARLQHRAKEARKQFVYVVKGVDAPEMAAYKELRLPRNRAGANVRFDRHYPYGTVAAQAIGFTGDAGGLEGLEYNYDDLLKGNSPRVRGRLPRHLRLTIDVELQSYVEHVLEDGIATTGARSAMAVVIEAGTGAVVVSAVVPTFDANKFGSYPAAQRRHRNLTDAFEPGSTIKPFVISRAIQDKIVDKDELLWCENGSWNVGDHTIHDSEPHGYLTPLQIISKSSNICTSKISQRLGKEGLVDALHSFGFGRKIQHDLPGETGGILRSPRRISEVGLATVSFGQGLSVTPLQLAAAYNVFASGGKFYEPYFVEAVLDGDHTVLSEVKPEVSGVALTPQTNEMIIRMLRAVVDQGTGEKAALEGISVAGKTGTAQVPDLINGGYKEDEYTALFAGLLPVDNPLYSVVVFVENPQTSIYGGQVAAPLFKKIARVLAVHSGEVPVLASTGTHKKVARKSRKEKTKKGEVPDFGGMNLREVLEIARAEQINVRVLGGGVVRKQYPVPGQKLQKGDGIFVTFDTKEESDAL